MLCRWESLHCNRAFAQTSLRLGYSCQVVTACWIYGCISSGGWPKWFFAVFDKPSEPDILSDIIWQFIINSPITSFWFDQISVDISMVEQSGSFCFEPARLHHSPVSGWQITERKTFTTVERKRDHCWWLRPLLFVGCIRGLCFHGKK